MLLFAVDCADSIAVDEAKAVAIANTMPVAKARFEADLKTEADGLTSNVALFFSLYTFVL